MAERAKPGAEVMCAVIAAWLALALGTSAAQQVGAGAPPQNEPEISTSEEHATFTSHVNLVLVPVVVRDRQGKVVAGLTKEQFHLFDRGKPQEISRFTVERPGGQPAAAEQRPLPDAMAAARPAATVPKRFVGYLFDDVHADTGDLMRASQAAQRHIETELEPTDRAAIFTTSGQETVNFTDDRSELRAGLARLIPRPIARPPTQQCPDISLYQADLIVNRNDAQSLAAAVAEAMVCMNLDPTDPSSAKTAQIDATAAARQTLSSGESESQFSLAALKDAVRRMAAMPGERVLVLVSPGFVTLAEHEPDVYAVIDAALHANVIVNALNLRGLYTTGVDASRTVRDAHAEVIKQGIMRQSEMAEDGLLAGIAAGAGGTYFHNSNDLAEGFRRTSSAPELYYVLGFQPQNLKFDGSFHGLKVALPSQTGVTVEARRGYYAPSHLENAAETARREITDAIYSREELSDVPVDLHTQFFKGPDGDASVTVLAHLDLARLKFRKENGRNIDNVTVVSALFDRNGNFVTGLVKHLDFRLRDEYLEPRLAKGIIVRMGLEAKPGSYAVRLVVRDSEGQMMSAVNGAVEIP